jgi:hypothetical protein
MFQNDFSTPDWLHEQANLRRDLTIAMWKQLAGDEFEELFISPANTITAIGHPNPNVRIAAMGICQDYWKCDHEQDYIDRCISLSQYDLSAQSRSAAIAALGFSFCKTNDDIIVNLLAHIVSDSGNTNAIRNAAYMALRMVENGLSFEFAMEHSAWDQNQEELLDINWIHLQQLIHKQAPGYGPSTPPS